MKMIYYKLFTEWNAFFETLPAESAGKLIKAIAFFTDDLKKNQTLDLDPDERIDGAIEKAEVERLNIIKALTFCVGNDTRQMTVVRVGQGRLKENGGRCKVF